MKKIYLILVAFMPLLSLAQPCTPNPNFNGTGISPGRLPDGIVGEAYDQTITMIVPVDTVVEFNGTPYNVKIDSAHVLSINGYPSGFTYQGNKPSLTWSGGEKGCAKLIGTPTESQIGNYSIYVTVQTWFKIVGLSNQFEQIDSSNIDFKVVTANGIFNTKPKEVVSVYPNPAKQTITAQINSYSNQISAKIINVLGQEFMVEPTSNSQLTFNIENLPEGVYFLELKDNEKVYIARFIKE